MMNCSEGQGTTHWLVVREIGTRLNSSHQIISYAVFCLKKKKKTSKKKITKLTHARHYTTEQQMAWHHLRLQTAT